MWIDAVFVYAALTGVASNAVAGPEILRNTVPVIPPRLNDAFGFEGCRIAVVLFVFYKAMQN